MDPTNRRRRMYRLAGRTFRYQIYVVLEVAWAIIAALVLAGEFLSQDKVPEGWRLALLLGTLAVAHTARMTMVHPWLLLKSMSLGSVVLGTAYISNKYYGWPINPLPISAIFATAYYLWLGELWTRDQAQKMLVLEEAKQATDQSKTGH